MGAHVAFYFDKDVNVIDDADYYTSIESSMTVTMAYQNRTEHVPPLNELI